MMSQFKAWIKPYAEKLENLLKFGKYTRVNGSNGTLQKVQIKNIRNLDECFKMGQFGFNSKAPIGSRAIVSRIGNEKIVISNEHIESIIDISSGNTVIYNQSGSYIKLENGTITFKCDNVNFDCTSIKHNGVRIDKDHIHSQPSDSNGDSEADTTSPIN